LIGPIVGSVQSPHRSSTPAAAFDDVNVNADPFNAVFGSGRGSVRSEDLVVADGDAITAADGICCGECGLMLETDKTIGFLLRCRCQSLPTLPVPPKKAAPDPELLTHCSSCAGTGFVESRDYLFTSGSTAVCRSCHTHQHRG
jgi:hypothetical protein